MATRKPETIIGAKELLLPGNKKIKSAGAFVISTIADITRSMRDEEYISYLAAIVEFSDDAIISKSVDGIIKSWNKGSEKMFGYTAEQAIGKHISLIIPPEYIDEEKKIVEKILSNQRIDHYETVRNKKGGEQFYVSLTVSPLKDQAGNIIGISKIVRDISTQKNSEADLIQANKELAFQNRDKEKRAAELVISNIELAFQNNEKEKRTNELIIANKELAFQNREKEKRADESELRYRSLIEQATDVICITDASFKFINVNPYGCEMFGYTSEEALQLSLFDIIFTEDLAENPLKVNELKLGKTIRNERRLKRKDGTAVHMEVSTKIMEDGMLIMFGHDITERKKTEEKLRKVNRLYTFVSQVNQNIVHIKNETALFHNSCRIAFEFGKFKMAWIGILDRTTKKINLVEQYGIPAEDLTLFTDTSYRKKGPQDHVLNKGGFYLCNNIEHDLALENWKPFAATHGIFSVIVLPIKKSGNIIGTFNLYASEINFFDKEEIALLIDVTEDISFALDVFEKAKKQKETEELILKNETRFRALIEKSNDMKTLSTLEGKMIYGSPSITKVLGYSREEFCGKSSFELIHPDDLPVFKEKRKQIMESPGSSFHSKNRFMHKNGKAIWCEGVVTNMLDEPGLNALVSNFRDISEEKIIEEQREFDSINLNALINNTTDLMWSVDKDFKLITFNQPFFDVIKFVSGKNLKEGDDVFAAVLSPEQFNRFKISYTRAFTGEAFTETEHIAAPVESWSEISYYPIRKGNEVIGTACHSRGVTERKKAEQAALHTLNEKNTILESFGDAFFAVDENWIVTYWNNHAENMLSVPKKEIVGHHLWEVFKSSIDSESYKKYHQALETRQVIHFEDYYPTLAKWYEISAYPSENGLSVYFQDVTERKISEIRLKKLNDDLHKQAKELAISNAELEQFAYVASHDLQEPLRMITSFLTQLERKYAGVIDARGKKYIDFAVDGAKRMRQIILDLLEFSRVGRTEDNLENIDLNELIHEIQVLFRKQIDEKKAAIIYDPLPQVQAHRSPIRQVFQNLIGNALKYTRENIAGKIQIHTTESETHWQFAVTDNGIGIGEEYFDKIFIIFQRLHNKDEFSGTGMGLAVTKKIIENLGGKIWLTSEEGKGSTFYFTIKK